MSSNIAPLPLITEDTSFTGRLKSFATKIKTYNPLASATQRALNANASDFIMGYVTSQIGNYQAFAIILGILALFANLFILIIGAMKAGWWSGLNKVMGAKKTAEKLKPTEIVLIGWFSGSLVGLLNGYFSLLLGMVGGIAALISGISKINKKQTTEPLTTTTTTDPLAKTAKNSAMVEIAMGSIIVGYTIAASGLIQLGALVDTTMKYASIFLVALTVYDVFYLRKGEATAKTTMTPGNGDSNMTY